MDRTHLQRQNIKFKLVSHLKLKLLFIFLSEQLGRWGVPQAIQAYKLYAVDDTPPAVPLPEPTMQDSDGCS